MIDTIHDTYYLVNLVDNDFMQESCLWEVAEKALAIRDEQLNSVSEKVVEVEEHTDQVCSASVAGV